MSQAMLSFSSSTKSSDSDWARTQAIPYLHTTADGEEASAEGDRSATTPLRHRVAIPIICTAPSGAHLPTTTTGYLSTLTTTRSDAPSETSSHCSPGVSRRFSTSSLMYGRSLTMSVDSHEPWLLPPGQRPFLSLTPKGIGTRPEFPSIRRSRSLEFEPPGPAWLDSPTADPGRSKPKDEVSDAEELEETGPSTKSLPIRTPSMRPLPLRRTLSDDVLPSKAFRANLLDFDSVKSFHNFSTKPATLRDQHLFWNVLWRAVFFPGCRTWWVAKAGRQTVTPKVFDLLRLLYCSHLVLLLLYLADLLPGLTSSELPEKCFWDLWRPCVTLAMFAIVHADVNAVALPKGEGHRKPHHAPRGHPPTPGSQPHSLGQKPLTPDHYEDEDCSDGSDSLSDGEDSLHRQLQLQEPGGGVELSVNTHRWSPEGRHRKETLTLKEFRNLLSLKVGAAPPSKLNLTMTRVCLFLLPLLPWAISLGTPIARCVPLPAFQPDACRAEWAALGEPSVGTLTSGLVGIVSTVCMFCLTRPLCNHLSEAEATFSRRLVYARYFKSITSSGKARRYGVPHFSLKNGANIRFWLALRGGRPWLAQHVEQRAADVVVTLCFGLSCILLGALLLASSKGDFPETQMDWEIVVCSAALSFWMLRFLVIGSQINAKYSDTTVLLTEQINLQLRMLVADSPEKLDRLKVTSNVLKVATKLLHELGKPTKISGLAMNKNFYNLMRVVVLSALSAALSEPLGFKVRLTTLAKMK